MGGRIDIVTLGLLAANLIFSLVAMNNFELKSRFVFNVGAILNRKEYYRLITGNFLHGSMGHLFVNMLSLYFCGGAVYQKFGAGGYLLIYFGSMLGGDLLSLLVQRKNFAYSALGASGAIAGIIFAFVYAVPDATFLLFFLLPCPAWLFALLFVGYSLFGIRTRSGNFAHEGHLGGAIMGMLLAIVLMPEVLAANWWIVALLVTPTALMIVIVVTRPELLMGKFGSRSGGIPRNNPFQRRRPGPRIVRDEPERKYHSQREELDALLDKVAQKGYGGLTKKEKQRLDELSGGGGA